MIYNFSPEKKNYENLSETMSFMTSFTYTVNILQFSAFLIVEGIGIVKMQQEERI